MHDDPLKEMASDEPAIPGFLQMFPWLVRGGLVLSALGFILLLTPWEKPRASAGPILAVGLTVVALCLLCEFVLNLIHWTPKRREQRKRLAEMAGKKKGRKEVWITKLSERPAEDGGTLIEVRKEVRKRVTQ